MQIQRIEILLIQEGTYRDQGERTMADRLCYVFSGLGTVRRSCMRRLVSNYCIYSGVS